MQKIFYTSLLFLVAGAATTVAQNALPGRYAAKNSTEAIFSFQHHVEFKSDAVPDEAMARRKINAQLTHLFGTMATAASPGVPRANHKITNVVVSPAKGGEYSAAYDYEGKVVVHDGPMTGYQVILPTHPDEVYNRSILWQGNQPTYPCTDAHYNGIDAFWYYWSPFRPGCRLAEGVDYLRVTGYLDRLENTRVTFPEYARLADETTGVISIHLFLGMNQPQGITAANPFSSNDLNAPNYRNIRANLIQGGYFSKPWSKAQIEALAGQSPVTPYVEELEKLTAQGTIRVRMFFGPTGLYDGSRAFHYFFKDAVEHGSVMLYGGHSGFGSNLNLTAVEAMEGFTITPPVDRYQIMFFNSCSSYPYYATDYFGRKQTSVDPDGTYNLDILTNGLETYFAVIGNTTTVVIQAIDAWATTGQSRSYQQIAAAIDSNNLFGISGDEDNPTSP